MENSLVVKTNLTSGTRSVGTVSGAYLNNGQTANQKMALIPGANYSSAVGFTAMTIGVTNGPVQLTASKGTNPTYINTMISQTTTIDDSVDTFVITNPNTNTLTATLSLTYAINNAGVTPAASIVTSVDGNTGDVTIKATDNDNRSGFSLIADSGATTGDIKLLRLVQGSNITLSNDGYGNMEITADIPPPPVTSVSGQVGAVVVEATDNNITSGTSLIADSGSTTGDIKLLRLVAGNNVTIAPDAEGNLAISSTGGTPPVTSVSGQLGDVTIQATDANAASGTSLISNSGATTGDIKLKTVVAGPNITVAPDVNGNIEVSATIPAAPVSSVSGQTGAVVVKALDGDDTTGTSLITDSGASTGIIKLKNLVAGTNITITPDGSGNLSIASTAASSNLITSVSGQIGAVVIKTIDNNSATGTSLVADSGATTGTVKLKTLVAGTGITLAPDTNGNLQISGSLSYTLPVATTTVLGGVKQGAGVAIAADGTLSSSGVLTVNGRSGAVTLTETDVGLPVDLMSGSNGTIATKYLPAAITGAVSYQGPWNASTNTPTITTGSAAAGNKGWYYVVSVAGTTTVDGVSTWNVGDWIISDGTLWSRLPISQTVSSVNNQTGAVVIQASDNNDGSGVSLIANSGATTGNIKFKNLVAGTGVTIAPDSFGNLTISGNASFSLPVATTTVLGGVKQGAGVSIAGDGTLSIAYALPKATTASLGGVVVGAGLTVDANGVIAASSYTLPAASASVLGGVKQGTGVTIAGDGTLSVSYSLPKATTASLGGVIVGSGLNVDSNGVLSATAGGYTLPVATATVLGGVKQGSGVSIAADGTLSSPTYSLPVATASVLGGVKQGAGVAIAGDGTISSTYSYSLPIASTTILGGVKQGAGLTIGSDGTITLIAPTASVLGGVKAGTNITIASDGTISTTAAAYTLPVATATVLGGVKQGSNVTIAGDGTISVAAPYTLPAATTAALGGVKAGSGLSVAADGTLSVTAPGGVTSFNTRTGAVTLTNADIVNAGGATLNAPAFTGRMSYVAETFTVFAQGSVSGATNFDFSTCTEITATVTGALSPTFINAPTTGNQAVILRLTNGGAFTITWPSNAWFSAGTPPGLSTSGVDILVLLYDSTASAWMIFNPGQAMAV